MIWVEYLIWHFIEVPQKIAKGILNFLRFGFHYFSLGFLLKTFFSPWHRFYWQYPRGFDPAKYFEIFLSNQISRLIGAIVRLFLILACFVFEISVIVGGMLSLLVWLFSPIVLIFSFLYGVKFLFTI